VTNYSAHNPKIQDACFSLLLNKAKAVPGSRLIIADENVRESNLQFLSCSQITIVTNRYDIFEHAKSLKINIFFSDFDFSDFPDNSFSQVLFRVSKEKALTHYIIKSAYRLLADNGELLMSGEKSDGIKTYGAKAAQYFGTSAQINKKGMAYLSITQRLEAEKNQLARHTIEDKDYAHLTKCVPFADQMLASKPGLFGWRKIDEGSAFLGDFFPEFLSFFNKEPANILDLGCGYGYLSIRASQHTKAKIVATDNNAAAIIACSKNFSTLALNGEVVASNCADNIGQLFDAIICNPPFHKGFKTDSELTRQFVASSYKRLKPRGMALFVVNRFVPLEDYAEKFFKIKLVAETTSFKLLLLTK
jgi:16S rRNA (guanine1207-N2)-methyltransferase